MVPSWSCEHSVESISVAWVTRNDMNQECVGITMSVSMRSTYSFSRCTRVDSWTSWRCTGPNMSLPSCSRLRLGPTCRMQERSPC